LSGQCLQLLSGQKNLFQAFEPLSTKIAERCAEKLNKTFSMLKAFTGRSIVITLAPGLTLNKSIGSASEAGSDSLDLSRCSPRH
jgi:hypothetical protein